MPNAHHNRQFQSQAWKNLLTIGACVVFIAVLTSCLRIVWRSWEVQKILEEENIELQQLQQEKLELEHSIRVASSSFELERRAREELLLQASDESTWRVE